MYVTVGLGNPGKEYDSTRHNVGFQVIDRVAALLDSSSWENKFDARFTRGRVADGRFMLVKPQTFMNKSGVAVQALLHFYKVPLEGLLVIVDDLDLEVGTVRLRGSGSDGGHRGLRSIIECMGSREFKRVRLGVGRPRPGESALGRVLKKVTNAEENNKLAEAIEQAARVAAEFITHGNFENWTSPKSS
jgi:PTH1 family peptidyl-tRNA hydrolase